ncbi:unnamed protein product [Closterium sp. NIES-53]
MRERFGSWVRLPFSAIPLGASYHLTPFDASSLALPLTRRAGIFTTQPRVAYCPPPRVCHRSQHPPWLSLWRSRLARLRGGDPAADDTAASRRSQRLETSSGFLPWLSSPPLQPDAVDSGAAGSGGVVSQLPSRPQESFSLQQLCEWVAGRRANFGGAGPGGGQQLPPQETLSPQQLHEWVVGHRADSGCAGVGGAEPGVLDAGTRAGGTGSRGAGAGARGTRGTEAGGIGGTGAGGTGARVAPDVDPTTHAAPIAVALGPPPTVAAQPVATFLALPTPDDALAQPTKSATAGGQAPAMVVGTAVQSRQQIVSEAMRDAHAGTASHCSSQRVAPSPAAPPRDARPIVALLTAAPPPAAPAASAPTPGGEAASACLRLPWVPPVAGMEFLGAGGGAVRAQYPPLVAVDPAPSAADDPLPSKTRPAQCVGMHLQCRLRRQPSPRPPPLQQQPSQSPPSPTSISKLPQQPSLTSQPSSLSQLDAVDSGVAVAQRAGSGGASFGGAWPGGANIGDAGSVSATVGGTGSGGAAHTGRPPKRQPPSLPQEPPQP